MEKRILHEEAPNGKPMLTFRQMACLSALLVRA
jgi:hypothetical protein